MFSQQVSSIRQSGARLSAVQNSARPSRVLSTVSRGGANDELYDQMEELENILLEERSARLAISKQVTGLVEDSQRHQNKLAGDLDGVSKF